MGRTLDEIIKTLPLSRRVCIERRYRELKRGLKRIRPRNAVSKARPKTR
jgi:hypothetical protein